jgi:hypothetical protein
LKTITSVLVSVLSLACASVLAQAPVCTLASNLATVASGDVFILTASCSPAATQYSWTGIGAPAQTSVPSILIVADNPTGSRVYRVVGAANGISGAAAEATVVVGSTTSPTPPTNPTNPQIPSTPIATPVALLPSACPATYATPAGLVVSNFSVGSPGRVQLSQSSRQAFRFVAPQSMNVGRVEMLSDNYSDGKDFSISSCPGDFSKTLPTACVSRVMGSTMLMFALDSPTPSAEMTRERCLLKAGATYYFNVRMSNQGVSLVTINARQF